MTKHLSDDLDRLKKEILAMGAMVEDAINKAITALVQRSPDLAREVLAGDDAIDRRELDVEDMCLKILALHQPVAGDLRFIIAVLKVNNDLERMGDHAQSIAERAIFLAAHDPIDVDLDFAGMVDTVRRMVAQSLDALVNADPELARSVCLQDDAVDDLHRSMFDVLQKLMTRDPATIERAVSVLSVSRNLERIADSATNVAEDIVFMVEGDVIRHQLRDKRRPRPARDFRSQR